MTSSGGLEVLPEWTPSRRASLGRFDLLVKVAPGHTIEDIAAARLELRDASGAPITVESPLLDASPAPLVGPAWRYVSGRLVEVGDEVAEAQAALGDLRSRPVERRLQHEPVTLVAIRDIVGIAREPHLWWRYYNATREQIAIGALLASTVLWLDGKAVRPPAVYNGPAMLPPCRGVSGLWSLDVLGVPAGEYRASLEITGIRSEMVLARSV